MIKKNVIDWINKCEGWKSAIKNIHWASKNLPQHELCDKIADRIAEFQDQVAEVEQSINGKMPLNKLKGVFYKVKDIRTFMEDVLDETNKFYKSLENDNYTGMRSDCESFLSDMQRFLYLVDFTLKEELRRDLREAMYKSIGKDDDFEVEKFNGRIPKTMKSRINRIYSIVKKYGIDSRLYTDDHWQAIDDYIKVISSLGCEVIVKPCGHIENAESMMSDGGYCDYAEDNMPRSKQYHIKIEFEDGMIIEGYIKCMAAGTVADPFSRYDTCMVLWPKKHRDLTEGMMSGRKIIIREDQLTKMLSNEIINEAAAKFRDGCKLTPVTFSTEWLPKEIEKLKLGEFGRFFYFVNKRLPIAKNDIKHLKEVNKLRYTINNALYKIKYIKSTDEVFYIAKERLIDPLKRLNEIFGEFAESMNNFCFTETFSNGTKEDDGFDNLFSLPFLYTTHNNIDRLVKELDSIIKSACPDNPSTNKPGFSGQRARTQIPSINKPRTGTNGSNVTKPSTGVNDERRKRPRIPKKVEPVSKFGNNK